MCDVIEVVLPGSVEGDAGAALKALEARTPVAAVKSLRLAAQWHYGSEAAVRMESAANKIELRLKQGQPWKRTLRNVLADVGPLLRAVAGREE